VVRGGAPILSRHPGAKRAARTDAANRQHQEFHRIEEFPLRYARGGVAASDTVPALLTPGEFVVRREAVQKIGASMYQQQTPPSDGSATGESGQGPEKGGDDVVDGEFKSV